ncbi:MAG: DUF6701 domain-containing protein [Halofilum sp. (in: g-proteobacteria)]|nr:DUF6701 domain-containing protein [Halofilum sp. (in: g-proteobacteria)]
MIDRDWLRAIAVSALLALLTVPLPARAITFVGSESSADNTTAITVTRPAGVAENDVMVAQLSFRGGSGVSPTPPSGWTETRRDDGSDIVQIAYLRVAGTSEPADYTWSMDGQRFTVAVISAYRGVDTSSPVDVHGGQTGTGSSVTAPSVTTSVDNARLVGLFSAARGGAFSAGPASMTTRANSGTGGGPNGIRGLLADEPLGTAGATGTRTADAGTNAAHIGQLIALRPAPAGAPAQVRFSIQPSDTVAGQVISPAVEVRVEDASGNLVSDSTAAITVAIENNPAGGTLSGTTTVNAVNGVATFSDLSIDNVGNGYTLRASATGLNPDISDPFNIVAPSQDANAFDTDTPAGEVVGTIGTKVAGVAFDLDVVAIENGVPSQPDNNEDFAAALLDASDNSGTLDGVNCRDSWTLIQDLGAFDFNDGSSDGRTTLAGIQENESWRQVRVRIERTFPPGQAGVVGCSNDAFAIRPDNLVEVQASDADRVTPGTTRMLDNTDPANGPVHVAGASFTLRARAVNGTGNTTTNYAGSPEVELTCVPAGASCVDGNLAPGTWNASSGTIQTDTAVYDEVGAFSLSLVDRDFAAIDQADSSEAERFVRSDVAVDVGRFVPADFLVEIVDNGDLEATCNVTFAFTYTGEPFGYAAAMEPELRITARNSAGNTTANYRGDYARLVAGDVVLGAPTEDASQTGRDGNPVGVTASLAAGTLVANGDGTLVHTFSSSDAFTYDKVDNARIEPFTPDLNLDVTGVTDSDAVAADPGVLPLTLTPAATHEIRFGRLVVDGAIGSELAPIDQPVRAEYWLDDTWQTNADDDCTTLALASEVQLANNDDPDSPVAGDQPIDVDGGTTGLTTADPVQLAGGQAALTFAAPGSGNTGWVDTTLTLTANRPWLRHDWDEDGSHDDLPAGRVTFGIYAGNPNWIHFRRTQ